MCHELTTAHSGYGLSSQLHTVDMDLNVGCHILKSPQLLVFHEFTSSHSGYALSTQLHTVEMDRQQSLAAIMFLSVAD